MRSKEMAPIDQMPCCRRLPQTTGSTQINIDINEAERVSCRGRCQGHDDVGSTDRYEVIHRSDLLYTYTSAGLAEKSTVFDNWTS